MERSWAAQLCLPAHGPGTHLLAERPDVQVGGGAEAQSRAAQGGADPRVPCKRAVALHERRRRRSQPTKWSHRRQFSSPKDQIKIGFARRPRAVGRSIQQLLRPGWVSGAAAAACAHSTARNKLGYAPTAAAAVFCRPARH